MSSSIKVRQTFKWKEKSFYLKKKKKKCAASTFILEIVLLADKIQIYVGGISGQSSPSAADCVGHQSHFQATMARYGCSNCSQLSAESFCLSPSNLHLSLYETLIRNYFLVLWRLDNAANQVQNHLKLLIVIVLLTFLCMSTVYHISDCDLLHI